VRAVTGSRVGWSSAPFDCLAIPEEQKKIVLALARARLEKDADIAFDDFVAGKGRGLNVPFTVRSKILYGLTYRPISSGPPGVGKTLTAKAVSEHLERPLYSVCSPAFDRNLLTLYDEDLCWGVEG
jgi:Cdc6-like AAA superfamily ATPase